VSTGGRIDELACNTQRFALAPYSALQDIAHAKLAADLLDVDGPVPVHQSRIPRDYEEPVDARQAGYDVVDNAFNEIVLLGRTANIREGKHRDRRLVRQSEGGDWRHDVGVPQHLWPHITVPPPRQRFDPDFFAGIACEGATDCGDLHGQVAVLDSLARPGGSEQSVLADRVTGAIQQQSLLGGARDTTKHAEITGAKNILLVGLDTRPSWANTGELSRSDSIILMHIPADHSQAYLVSLPRDSYVQIPAYDNGKVPYAGGHNKINAAFAYGSRGLTGAPALSVPGAPSVVAHSS